MPAQSHTVAVLWVCGSWGGTMAGTTQQHTCGGRSCLEDMQQLRCLQVLQLWLQSPTLISPANRVLKPDASNELISVTPLLPASKLL